MKQVGKQLREIRKKLGKKQSELAEEFGFHVQYIGKVERNEQTPSFNLIYKYYEKYQASIDYILTGQGRMFLHDRDTLRLLSPEDIEILNLLKTRLTKEEQVHLWGAIMLIIKAIIHKREEQELRLPADF
jgi:transcriptional regulator with XRE-family HTH domain